MENLNCGDVVILTSGGAEMTVKSQDGNIVHCIWMDKNDNIKEKGFERELLEKCARGWVGGDG